MPLAPSPIPSQFTGVGDAVVPKELTVGEIDRIVERFAEAARRSRDAGFDAVELHGAHGYLIGEFLSPDSNKREDEYGGSVQGRAYFCVRLIRAIKARLGADYPVIVRMNGRDHVQHGLELDDAVEMAVDVRGGRRGFDQRVRRRACVAALHGRPRHVGRSRLLRELRRCDPAGGSRSP